MRFGFSAWNRCGQKIKTKFQKLALGVEGLESQRPLKGADLVWEGQDRRAEVRAPPGENGARGRPAASTVSLQALGWGGGQATPAGKG